MTVHREIRGALVIARRLDVADRRPLHESRQVRGEVGPSLSTVARELHLAVVRPRPDHTGLEPGLCNGEHDARVLNADVVRCQSARRAQVRRIISREIGADQAPRLPAVGGAVHVLTADVHGVVIVRRDRERKGPDEAILRVSRRPADRCLGPDFGVLRDAGAEVELGDDSAHASKSRRARPHNVRVHRVRCGPAAFAATHRAPFTARNDRSRLRVARPTRGRTILSIAVHEIGNAVVDRHVVHLRQRQLYLEPALAAIRRHREATVVAHRHPVAIRRVDPDVVVVAARRFAFRRIRDRLAAVERLRPARREEVRLVLVVGHHAHAAVVRCATHDLPVARDERPLLTPIVGAPQPSLLPVGKVPRRHAVARLDERVHTVGVGL